MQSRTHQPGHWSPWETTADVKGEEKSRLNRTERRFYDDDHTQTFPSVTPQAQHTLSMTRLRYTLVVVEGSSPELDSSALVVP